MIAAFTLGAPARAQDNDDLLKQAEDLVHQAWNPGGDPPSDDQRLQLLTKAEDLARKAPQRHVHHHRKQAVLLIGAIVDQIKAGDPDKKVDSMLKDADAELREAVSESD
ncbi:MAG: hypothetical protein WDO13_11590 [Verrucomicrobiota bacterium]